MPEIQNEIPPQWIYIYFILAVIYVILLIVYLFFTRDFCFTNSSKLAKASYAVFIAALIMKLASYFISGSLIINNNSLIKRYQCICSENCTNCNCINCNCSENCKKCDFSEFKRNQIISTISSAFPGYATAAAYCMIFFSWCSICIEVMEKKSSTFYGCSRWTLLTLLFIIVAGFAISISITSVYAHIGSSETSKRAHIAEATIAIMRDLLISISFIIYLVKMWEIFADPWVSIKSLIKSFFYKYFCCCLPSSDNRKQESISLFINYESNINESSSNSSNKNTRHSTVSNGSNNNNSYEAQLILMCLSIIISLFVRAASIIAYTILTSMEDIKCPVCDTINSKEYSNGYFVAFAIESLFSELLPVIAIIAYRISQPIGQVLRETDLGFE